MGGADVGRTWVSHSRHSRMSTKSITRPRRKQRKIQKVAVGQHTHLASLGTMRVVRREVERNFTTTSSPEAREPFYVAIITPVIHYCMGGSEVNAKGQVMGKS